MLRGYAEAGKLHVYVSAMQRCMQTADPLLTSLGVEATIEPKLMEIPGLCAGPDRLWLARHVRPVPVVRLAP